MLLFTFQEVPQTSTGFSPFELLYRCTVRGPLAILKALWTDEETDEVMKTTYEYVTDLHNCLEKVGQLARKNLTITKTDKLSITIRKLNPISSK